jgi:hypothetical protein
MLTTPHCQTASPNGLLSGRADVSVCTTLVLYRKYNDLTQSHVTTTLQYRTICLRHNSLPQVNIMIIVKSKKINGRDEIRIYSLAGNPEKKKHLNDLGVDNIQY